ncbi:MAG: peptidyl-prolyl cis-trans isomerase [Bacteroidetes bacterium]|nr:peptidyl-prolyl cis-trans isomerase [Bacteroidota bacterium]
MIKSKIYTLAFVAITAGAFAQDQVVMTVCNKKVTKTEFEAVYKKNNGKDANNNSKSMKEYVDLFSMFMRKVCEAEQLGLDTLSSFKTELAGYRKQLAAPYLTDKNTNESLLTEAYDRLKTEVKVSHILFRIPENALPKDTIEGYTRATIVRNALMGKMPSQSEIANYDKLLKASEEIFYPLKRHDSALYKVKINSIKNLPEYVKNADDKFQAIAMKSSDDPSVVDNKGDIGYFTAFDMVYPFENAAYNTKVGEISQIIRTKYGYHVLKVYDRRPSRGEIFTAHIMTKFPKDAKDIDKENAKKKIFEIYDSLKKGSNFEKLALKYSDDIQSKNRGGQLQPFKSGRLPKEYEDAAFALQNDGDYSQPIMTAYGWHIIKRLSLKKTGTFDEVKNELKTRVNRDSRSQMGREVLIANVKKENKFKENLKNRDEMCKVIDSTYLKSTWKASRAEKLGNKEIFNLAGKSYKQNDFAKYIESQMTFRSTTDPCEVIKNMYNGWVEEQIVNFEDARLETKYADFKNLLLEYRNGILIFDLTDQKVWSKAVRDTAGLRTYYEKNKEKYLWEERADVTTYGCSNEKIANEVRKMLEHKKSEKEITETINKKSQLNLSIENVTYLKGENKNLENNWKTGLAAKNIIDDKDKKVLVIYINNILPKTPKKLNECKGMVTADYQNYLETEWLQELKNKYPVTVNDNVLNSMK